MIKYLYNQFKFNFEYFFIVNDKERYKLWIWFGNLSEEKFINNTLN